MPTNTSLVEDPMFVTNMKGAQAAGIPVGVYFFTQAVDEKEAGEEASAVIELIRDYRLNYPVFIDTEDVYKRQEEYYADEDYEEEPAPTGRRKTGGKKPVSYTHLDVYKRQPSRRRRKPSFRCIMPVWPARWTPLWTSQKDIT